MVMADDSKQSKRTVSEALPQGPAKMEQEIGYAEEVGTTSGKVPRLLMRNGTLINAYCKTGLNKEAFLWLGEMYKQGMEPNEVTMGIIAQCISRMCAQCA